MSNLTGYVFDIYRGTTHDGPGMRDTVFLKGCPLHCEWCHNPEGISPHQEIWWEQSKCIGCAACVDSCENAALSIDHDGIHISRKACISCLKCVSVCPSRAMQSIRKEYSVQDLMDELLKDEIYYRTGSGGVTVSGGECMLQPDFIEELLKQLREKGINTAVDTCGYVPYSFFERVLPFTDYVLYDLKIADPIKHKKYTGVDNELILKNFYSLISDIASNQIPSKIWIRTPLIPNATATKENIQSIAALIAPHLGKEIARWEMCAFNNACSTKYRRLSRDWMYFGETHIAQSFAESLRSIAISKGCSADKVILTGILM